MGGGSLQRPAHDDRGALPGVLAEARPLVDMDELRTLLLLFKQMGGKVVVTTWLAKEADKAYDDAVRTVKKAWLDMWMFPYDELHMVRYGTTKANCTRRHGNGQTLFDDNAKIRQGWHLGDAGAGGGRCS